ncbi:hypothetical protein C8K18_12374 [Paraburkholderia sp. GV068]|uniref:hypothetical protein n=1 Tax=Paraburkholderia TaxID=1822464 RepID=UPI000D3F1BD7|nr:MULTISPECIES: hypothetical protein [unclassified Paraburkholderia]PTQ92122.1 hypothetical protein C8K19_12374 [Paraburkholderia sp. GV072]PUA94332.1 hypothetical protein C8K18_12374 [Paraburkholderia sp. GV068]
MGFLKLALIIAVVAGVTKGIQLFNRRCLWRFGHTFFTLRVFSLTAIAVNLIWWGLYFWAKASQQHAPTSN